MRTLADMGNSNGRIGVDIRCSCGQVWQTVTWESNLGYFDAGKRHGVEMKMEVPGPFGLRRYTCGCRRVCWVPTARITEASRRAAMQNRCHVDV
jgi:hypothetical protein